MATTAAWNRVWELVTTIDHCHFDFGSLPHSVCLEQPIEIVDYAILRFLANLCKIIFIFETVGGICPQQHFMWALFQLGNFRRTSKGNRHGLHSFSSTINDFTDHQCWPSQYRHRKIQKYHHRFDQPFPILFETIFNSNNVLQQFETAILKIIYVFIARPLTAEICRMTAQVWLGSTIIMNSTLGTGSRSVHIITPWLTKTVI